MEENKGTGWSLATGLWVLVGIIAVIALFRWCDKQGDNKAELAASIQKLNGRQEVIGAIVTNHSAQINDLNSVTSGTVAGLGALRQSYDYTTGKFLNDLYTPNCNDRNGGCVRDGFVRRDFYTPSGSCVSNVTTCG